MPFYNLDFVGPIFVIQWIYDLAQIGEDNPELWESLLPLINKSEEYSQYLHCLEQRVRLSLKSVRYGGYISSIIPPIFKGIEADSSHVQLTADKSYSIKSFDSVMVGVCIVKPL